MRPVLWAAWFGHLEAMKFLINSGATPRCTNKQGMGILHCAAQNSHVHIMNFIFESLEDFKVDEMEKSDRTALFLAAEEGHIESVMRLIDMRCDVTIRDKEGETAVHVAARKGHHHVVKRLLMIGALVDDRDVDGRTALHVAADNGHADVVDVLLEFNAGADTETIKGMTPLHFAATNGHDEVVMTIIKNGANIDAQNFQGNTALHLATLGNSRHIIEILIQANCDINIANNRQQTAIHVAVENGFQESVEVLLAGGANLSRREKLGKTPLQLASRGSFVAIVDMIIKAERYYAVTREYMEQELDYVDPHQYLRTPKHPSSTQMKDILWKLATKQLKPGDWKKLAIHWKFTSDHIRCIEHQYTGTTSHREHGFRLLMIWLHGVRKDENVIKLLFEALVAIDRRGLAEQMRGKSEARSPKVCMGKMCAMC
ncbi:ankyrin repeat and death domain-containing protein 1A-like isoform X7 [Mytilus californianus]|nr:ankyrin repeat and death domain-containing protein 1A-like isoform X7 [Mytilus californianus]